MTKEEVEDFSRLNSSSPVSYLMFLQKYPDSPFRKTVKEMFIDSVIETGNYSNFADVGFSEVSDYYKVKLAEIYRKRGFEVKARELYKKVFSETNSYDEQIITDNVGNADFLMGNQTIIANKVWFAIKNRNFDIAKFYLSLLPPDNRFYLYFKGVILYKTGKRKKAILCFKNSYLPEALFFRLILEKDPFVKIELLQELLSSNARRSFKISGARITLNKLLVSNLPLFKLALDNVKNFDSFLYKEYLAKYYVNVGQFKSALSVLKSMHTHYAEGLIATIEFAVFGKKLNLKRNNFYSFVLTGKKPEVTFLKPSISMISDEGLRFILNRKRYFLLNFVDFSQVSPFDAAVTCYLAKRYRDAIRFAAKSLDKKVSKKRKAVLYTILYPSPSVFKDDIVSLSVARQESLFDPGAFSKSGAIGYMQIMPFTGKYIASIKGNNFNVSDLYDAKTNVAYGTFYIRKLIKQFGSLPLAAAAYNAGPGRINRLLKLYGGVNSNSDFVLFIDTFLPLDETRNYVKKVVSNCFFYSKKFGVSDEICRVR
ncbi:lytic transglycosylase domain-containing protein [Desulfurobacterium sp.]